MAKIVDSHESLTLEQILKFELKHNVEFTDQYRKFLLNYNGGYSIPNIFKISMDQGESALNVFYGIGDMYDNLEDFLEIFDERLPQGFIPIAEDSNGNIICLGTNEKYYEKIYFWDHEQESETPDDMSNMFFLAININDFLDQLYEENQ